MSSEIIFLLSFYRKHALENLSSSNINVIARLVQVNMDKPSMASVKLYAEELKSHFQSYLYVVDVIVGILLWRGRATLPFSISTSRKET